MNSREYFLKHIAQTSHLPMAIEVATAKGVNLIDTKGKQYIDLISGIAVSNLGHQNHDITEAIKAQADKYLHTMVYGEHIQSPQIELSRKLMQVLPSQLDSVYFTNSGSEAVEGAMKLAKKFTGRYEFVAYEKSYHGSTQGALSLMSDEYWKQNYRPLLPGITFIKFNDESELIRITTNTAAVFCEVVKAEAGVWVGDKSYFKALRNRCTETGTLLILDENQTAMGRTGKLFGFEHYDFIPDVLVLGKAFGGGMPLGAFISSQNIMKAFADNPVLGHITTFGGHPVSCAASLAAINFLNNNKLTEPICHKETLFRELLKHRNIIEVRSLGLLIAVEIVNEEICQMAIQKCLENGLMIDWFLFAPNCMRIAPPLIINEAEIKLACEIILSALDSL